MHLYFSLQHVQTISLQGYVPLKMALQGHVPLMMALQVHVQLMMPLTLLTTVIVMIMINMTNFARLKKRFCQRDATRLTLIWLNWTDSRSTCNTSLMCTKGQLLSLQLTMESFTNNDEKTKFYTGVPTFSLLMHVFNIIAPSIKVTTQNALGQFQEFLLVLIRLKLNSPLQDLAFRSNISVPSPELSRVGLFVTSTLLYT